MNTADIPEISNKQMDDLVERFLTQGATFKEIKGLTDDEMEAIYTVGYNLVQNGKHQEAEKIFKFLCFFDHLQHKYWLGLGACRKALKDWAGAINAYGFAGLLNVNDPRAAMQASECHTALGNTEEAESGLHAAIKFAGEQPQFAAIKERAQLMLAGKK